MINTTARVISAHKGKITFEADTKSGCSSCTSRSNCGVSGLGKYFASRRKPIEVNCDVHVNAGDAVQLSMSEGDLLKAGAMAYLLPSVLALIVAGIASSFGWGDIGAVLGAGVGFVAGFLLTRITAWVPRLVVQKNLSKGETS